MDSQKTTNKNTADKNTEYTQNVATIDEKGTQLITQKIIKRNKAGDIIAEELSKCICSPNRTEQATYHTISTKYLEGTPVLKVETFPDGVQEITDSQGNITRVTECDKWLKTEKTTGRVKETKTFYKNSYNNKYMEREVHDTENGILVQVEYDKDDTTRATIKKVHGVSAIRRDEEKQSKPQKPNQKLISTEECNGIRIETWEWPQQRGYTTQKQLFKTDSDNTDKPILTVQYNVRRSAFTSTEAKCILIKEYGEIPKSKSYEMVKGQKRNRYGLCECYTINNRTYIILYSKIIDTVLGTERTEVSVLIRSHNNGIVLDEQYTVSADEKMLIKQKYHIYIEDEDGTKYTITNREEQSLHPSPSHISEKIKNMSQQINDQQINEEFFEKIIQEKLLKA